MQSKKLRNVLISFIVLLICLVSFIGIYVQDKNEMVNVIPDYILGVNLKGGRVLELKVSDEKKYSSKRQRWQCSKRHKKC